MREPYRRRRFMAFLNPWADPGDTGYHIIQGLYALGSGGLFGVGLGQGRQKFLYLPEAHTDFIFAIIGEELGFVGCVAIITLFFFFAWRGFKAALNAPDSFSCLLATGITAMVTVQALINIGVVTASMPITGIPLPFISYGGSSLVPVMYSVGILLNISKYCQE
jgi:cell division protein FtsW